VKIKKLEVMKNRRIKIKLIAFFISVFMCFNTYGQNTYIGKIDAAYSPYAIGLCKDCVVITLGTISGDTYFLTLDSLLLPTDSGKLIVGDAEYWDDVEITGTTTVKQGGYLKEYYELEIETIEKTSLNQDIQRFLGAYVIEKKDCDIYPNRIVIIEWENVFLLYLDDHYYDLFAFLFIFVEEDSLFIPMQWCNPYRYYESSFRGKGKVENDSIFLNIIIGNYHVNDFSINHFDTCNIKGIKKGVGNIPSIEPISIKVYYNAIHQEIVIDAGLQNQSLTLVLYDIQGKILLQKTNVSNSISIAHLPQGVYVYRLMQGNQVICRGKVLK
jgi:hypothetical protein